VYSLRQCFVNVASCVSCKHNNCNAAKWPSIVCNAELCMYNCCATNFTEAGTSDDSSFDRSGRQELMSLAQHVHQVRPPAAASQFDCVSLFSVHTKRSCNLLLPVVVLAVAPLAALRVGTGGSAVSWRYIASAATGHRPYIAPFLVSSKLHATARVLRY
jgi:hypothetical protein